MAKATIRNITTERGKSEMRIRSKNKYIMRLIARIYHLPIYKVNFVYINEKCDPELTELAFLTQSKHRFEELAEEFLKGIDDDIAKTTN
jgi:hypothetical protein